MIKGPVTFSRAGIFDKIVEMLLIDVRSFSNSKRAILNNFIELILKVTESL